MSDQYPLAIFGDTLANVDVFELQSLQDDQRVNCLTLRLRLQNFKHQRHSMIMITGITYQNIGLMAPYAIIHRNDSVLFFTSFYFNDRSYSRMPVT